MIDAMSSSNIYGVEDNVDILELINQYTMLCNSGCKYRFELFHGKVYTKSDNI